MKKVLVREDQASVYEHWYTPAIWNMLAIMQVRDNYREVGERCDPPLTAAQVTQALRALEAAGMARRRRDGRWVRRAKTVSSGTRRPLKATDGYHEQTTDLGRRAIRRWPEKERVISAVSLATTARGYAKIRRILAETRNRVLEVARESKKADRVALVNVQLFPVTVTGRGKSCE